MDHIYFFRNTVRFGLNTPRPHSKYHPLVKVKFLTFPIFGLALFKYPKCSVFFREKIVFWNFRSKIERVSKKAGFFSTPEKNKTFSGERVSEF